MEFTENMLDSYSQPLSSTEDQMCKNAISMVRDALKPLGFTDDNKDISLLYSDTLAYSLEMRSMFSSRRIKLFVQGSYANNTNVRTQSDVDVAVVQENPFTTHYRPDISDDIYGFSTVETPPVTFKDDVQRALYDKFDGDVERKDKSIKIHGNTNRKDADAVPCQRDRDYRNDYRNDASNFIGGILIRPDSGGCVINYPEQHIANGRQKNTLTHGYYKRMVRIMKKMRYLMEDAGYATASGTSSFILESLLWNVPDAWYLEYCDKYLKVFAFDQLINLLIANKANFTSYKEANGIKPLCEDNEKYLKLYAFLDSLRIYYRYM